MTLAIADHHSQPKHVVLCIDDDMQMLNVLDAFLTNSGYRVLTASTPESALMLFLNNHVDAVVTDYEIGEATREDIIRSLRSLRPGIPVVLFSGAECLPNTVLTLADGSVHKTQTGMLRVELAKLLGRV
jgi:DNA-binding NtrC family response regulator